MAENRQMTPEDFRRQLGEILAFAGQQGNCVDEEQVRSFFSDSGLSDEQLRLVCEFLLSRKVIVRGYSGRNPESGSAEERNTDFSSDAPDSAGQCGQERMLSQEERRWLELYREELGQLRPVQEAEREELLQRLRQHKEEAVRRLTEMLLPEVLELALQMERRQTMLQDLVQEGNLRLLIAGERTDWRMTGSLEAAQEQLLSAVSEALKALEAEQEEVRIRDRKMVEKAENLKAGIDVLKEEMGRKVYLDEVADFLSISEEEVEDILRLTGEEPSDEDA